MALIRVSLNDKKQDPWRGPYLQGERVVESGGGLPHAAITADPDPQPGEIAGNDLQPDDAHLKTISIV